MKPPFARRLFPFAVFFPLCVLPLLTACLAGKRVQPMKAVVAEAASVSPTEEELDEHGCPAGMDKAVVRLQESARATVSLKEWSAQIVSKTPRGQDLSASKNLKAYLSDVTILQDADEHAGTSRRTFSEGNHSSETYAYVYPASASVFPDSGDDTSASACGLNILVLTATTTEDDEDEDGAFVSESAFVYYFQMEDGEMKLIDFVHVAG